MISSLSKHEQRILSRPFPVEWAGWETTTQRLYQHGWQIAGEFNYFDNKYRFMLRHEQLDLMAFVDWIRIDPLFAGIDSYATASESQLPVLHAEHIARTFNMYRPPVMAEGTSPWTLYDCIPQFSAAPIRQMEDFNVFAKLQPKEILIPQADMSVVEQLEAIIKAQEPKQHELRQLILAKPRGLRRIASIAEVA